MTIWSDLTGLSFCVAFVNAGGVRTRALVAGEGEDVIMLHGTSGHLEAFSRNIGAHVSAGFRCHAVDMLGHGYTGKPNEKLEIPKYGKHILDYLDAQNIKRAHFIGESLGGWVSAWVAINHPDRVRSVQLVAAGGTKANPEVMKKIKESTLNAVVTDDIETTRSRMRLLMHDPVNATEELVQLRHAIYHAPDFVANIQNLLCLQEMEIRQRNLLRPDDLAKIKAPILVVWGRNNPFGDVPEAHAMHAAIPGARLELYDACGHWPQHEHPDKFNPMSIDFLRAAKAA